MVAQAQEPQARSGSEQLNGAGDVGDKDDKERGPSQSRSQQGNAVDNLAIVPVGLPGSTLSNEEPISKRSGSRSLGSPQRNGQQAASPSSKRAARRSMSSRSRSPPKRSASRRSGSRRSAGRRSVRRRSASRRRSGGRPGRRSGSRRSGRRRSRSRSARRSRRRSPSSRSRSLRRRSASRLRRQRRSRSRRRSASRRWRPGQGRRNGGPPPRRKPFGRRSPSTQRRKSRSRSPISCPSECEGPNTKGHWRVASEFPSVAGQRRLSVRGPWRETRELAVADKKMLWKAYEEGGPEAVNTARAQIFFLYRAKPSIVRHPS